MKKQRLKKQRQTSFRGIGDMLGDEDSDRLTGAAGADLFIINTGDTITDFYFGKPKTNKDGDVVVKDGLIVT